MARWRIEHRLGENIRARKSPPVFCDALKKATRRFFEGVAKNGRRFASPNVFPETVFNSPTSHVAAVLGATGPCYSLVGDDAAWVSALDVASCWLANGSVEYALVIG